MIADFPESDPAKLGRLLLDAEDALLEALAAQPGDRPMLHAGVPFTVAQFACTMLGDQMLHGYEMAAAIGRPWPIDTPDALLILEAHLPLFGAMLHARAARRVSLPRSGIELRGGRDVTVRFTDGAYSVEEGTAEAVDATMSVDPVAFLMIESGRLSRYEAVALGLLDRRRQPTRPRPRLLRPDRVPLRGGTAVFVSPYFDPSLDWREIAVRAHQLLTQTASDELIDELASPEPAPEELRRCWPRPGGGRPPAGG